MKTASALFPLLALALLFAQPAASSAQTAASAPIPAKTATKPAMETKNFGDWRLECLTIKTGRKACRLLQIIATDKTADKKKHMILVARAGINHEKGKDGTVKTVTVLALMTPLGTLLPEKLSLQLDAEKQVQVPFVVCLPQEGCVAELQLGDVLLGKIKSGKKLTVGYKPINSKKVSASVSLNGLSDGLKAMAEKQG